MQTPSPEYRYWAFISYSSKDKAWGRWLHRTIETYGIPTQLVSHPTPAGYPAPKRFQPIFRDREELPAASDLGAQIEEALRISRFLIVVCSPRAAQSRWVNKEIETFQKFDRQGRILAIIVDGEPNTGGERECFPPALRQFEPIAADARPQGDGKTNAKLKLLAGMLGVRFDVLKQRDTHRQIRRLQFAMALAMLVVMSLAGMAWYSNHQRIKAVKARQQAESILQYLLYDLHDKLEPVGRLDILHDVQKRVYKYYLELGVENSDVNVLRNRATAFNNEGDLVFSQGDLAGALKAHRESQTICQRLADSDPSNTGWQRSLSVSHNRMGDMLIEQGDLAGALRECRASLAIIERLAASDPGNTGWQRDLSVSHNGLGNVLIAQGDLAGALEAYRKNRTIIERLAASDPSNVLWQRDLSVSHNKLGNVLIAQGDLAGALQEYRASLAVIERLAPSDPNNVSLQRDLLPAHCFVGIVLQKQGDLAGALREYRASLAVIERLAPSDPSNALWQRDLWGSHNNLGDVLIAQGDLAGALQEYRAGLAVIERLAASDPSNALWQQDLQVSYWNMADISEKSGQTAEAKDWWRKAQDTLAGMK